MTTVISLPVCFRTFAHIGLGAYSSQAQMRDFKLFTINIIQTYQFHHGF